MTPPVQQFVDDCADWLNIRGVYRYPENYGYELHFLIYERVEDYAASIRPNISGPESSAENMGFLQSNKIPTKV